MKTIKRIGLGMLLAAVALAAGTAAAASWYQLPLTYSNGTASFFSSTENPCYLFDNASRKI